MKHVVAAGILALAFTSSVWALSDGLGASGANTNAAPKPMAPPMMGGEGGAATFPYENGGKVLTEKSGAGYTYLELENQGHKYWIAGPTTKVKKGDKVSVSPNVVMEGFTSKFMNRTFDRIVFVSAIKIVK